MPVYAVKTMNHIVAGATSSTRFISLLLTVFSAMALLLACVGLYGTLAYAVTTRTREIGIRMALGAKPAGILQLLGREVLIVGIAGLAIGLFGARLGGHAVAGLLYQVEPTDPPTLIGVSLVLMLAASLAGLLPARRASRINPVAALRED